jgi:hypothetical protein
MVKSTTRTTDFPSIDHRQKIHQPSNDILKFSRHDQIAVKIKPLYLTHYASARDAPAPGGCDPAQKRTPYLRMRHTVYLSLHTFKIIQYYIKSCFSYSTA